MAAGQMKGAWPIWILIVVAIVLGVLAFQKDRPGVQDTTQGATSDPMLKPAHSESDQSEAGAFRAHEAIVMPPQQIPVNERFAVQVYSFKDEDRAQTSFARLKDAGYENAYIMVSDLGVRGVFHRVRVGPFSNEGEAQETLEKIKEDFQSGIIVSE
ncbi:MAG: SPOR domain-containing protein [Elusimicrobia bacterium]|nr:SPOR domain-containing protein [Elusimicrobiota bacterium]